MTRCIALILAAALAATAPVAARAEFKKVKIAVLDFTLQGEDFETKDMGAIVAEWFITALVKAGRFDVVERGMLNKIIEEQKLSMSGVVDETTASRLGKLLGVETIISGSVLKLQNILEINARIIDVETASIKAAENVKSPAASRLQDLVVQMSEKIIKNFPLQGYVVSKSEGKVTIDVGRSAGAKPGMEFVVYKEGEVIRHPKTGEILDVEQIQTGRVVLCSIRDNLSECKIVSEEAEGAIAYGQLVYSASDHPEEEKPAPAPQAAPAAEPGRLFVDAEPGSALVRILNIGPRYHAGIVLDPGSYHVEVSAPGHRARTEWVSVGPGETRRVAVSLEKRAEAAAPPPVAQPAAANPEAAGPPAPAAGASAPKPAAPAAAPQSELPDDVRYHVRMLRSGSPASIVSSSKKIVRAGSFHPAILQTAQSVLLAGYRSNASDGHYVDAMSWLCNVLGASGRGAYRSTLQTVAQGAPNRKLQKYALKNMNRLN